MYFTGSCTFYVKQVLYAYTPAPFGMYGSVKAVGMLPHHVCWQKICVSTEIQVNMQESGNLEIFSLQPFSASAITRSRNVTTSTMDKGSHTQQQNKTKQTYKYSNPWWSSWGSKKKKKAKSTMSLTKPPSPLL